MNVATIQKAIRGKGPRTGRVEVFPERDENGTPTGQWCYRLVGRNGEPMVVSEAFTRHQDARRGARRFLIVAARLLERLAENERHPDTYPPVIKVVDR